MAGASRAKASDRQDVCKKLTAMLKKHYKGAPPEGGRPVLEELLYAVCLENADDAQAEAVWQRLRDEFHDWNEILVSALSEIAVAFEGTDDPERKALEVRNVLQYVFEKHYAFDFDVLKKKTLEQAVKHLGRIRELSYFVRAWALQESLGSHSVPVDDRMAHVAVWLGLADVGASPEDVSNALRPVVRKADAPRFCWLLRNFAADPAVQQKVDADLASPPEEGFDLLAAPSRAAELLQGDAGTAGPPRKAASKGAAASGRKTPKKSASKSAGKKTSRKSRPASAG